MNDRELIQRMTTLIDALIPMLAAAAQRERRAANNGLRQISWQERHAEAKRLLDLAVAAGAYVPEEDEA